MTVVKIMNKIGQENIPFKIRFFNSNYKLIIEGSFKFIEKFASKKFYDMDVKEYRMNYYRHTVDIILDINL